MEKKICMLSFTIEISLMESILIIDKLMVTLVALSVNEYKSQILVSRNDITTLLTYNITKHSCNFLNTK